MSESLENVAACFQFWHIGELWDDTDRKNLSDLDQALEQTLVQMLEDPELTEEAWTEWEKNCLDIFERIRLTQPEVPVEVGMRLEYGNQTGEVCEIQNPEEANQ